MLIFISPNKLWPILYNRRGSYPTYFRRIAFISETHHIIYQIQPIPQNSQEQQQQPPLPLCHYHQEKNNQPLPSGLKWCLRTLCREALEPQILDTRFTMGFSSTSLASLASLDVSAVSLGSTHAESGIDTKSCVKCRSLSSTIYKSFILDGLHSTKIIPKTHKESMVVQICCFWDVFGMFWKQKWYNCDLLSSLRDSLHINDTPSLSNPPLHSPCAHRCRRCSQSMKYGLHRRSGEKCHWNNAIANSLVHSRCILSVVDI